MNVTRRFQPRPLRCQSALIKTATFQSWFSMPDTMAYGKQLANQVLEISGQLINPENVLLELGIQRRIEDETPIVGVGRLLPPAGEDEKSQLCQELASFCEQPI